MTPEQIISLHPEHADRIREDIGNGLSAAETLADIAAVDARQALRLAHSAVEKARRIEESLVSTTGIINEIASIIKGNS